jgi:hypothetical protein
MALLLDTATSVFATPTGDPNNGNNPCGFSAASVETGACGMPQFWTYCHLIGGWGGRQACLNPPEGVTPGEDKQDFPLACFETNERTNCNMPGEACYRATTCVWDAGRCVKGEPAGPWFPKPKRTTEPCDD